MLTHLRARCCSNGCCVKRKSLLTRQQLDTIDRHIAELRQLIYRQVQLVEKDKLESHDAERVQNLLATLNDLMSDYQILRRKISTAAEQD